MHYVFDWKRNELRHIYAAQSQPHGETPGCGDHNILSILTTIDLFRLIITSLLLIPRQIVMIDWTWRKSFNAPQSQTWELFVPGLSRPTCLVSPSSGGGSFKGHVKGQQTQTVCWKRVNCFCDCVNRTHGVLREDDANQRSTFRRRASKTNYFKSTIK